MGLFLGCGSFWVVLNSIIYIIFNMAVVSVSVPVALKSQMDALDEVNWSAVARKAFERKVAEQEFLTKLT